VNKTKRKKQRKRVQRLADKWFGPLGLLWWDRIRLVYSTERAGFKGANDTEAVFEVWSAWEYLAADIKVNLKLVATIDDYRLERCFVHECVHILLNEMQAEGADHKHEERTVTRVMQAIFWVRAAAQTGKLKGKT